MLVVACPDHNIIPLALSAPGSALKCGLATEECDTFRNRPPPIHPQGGTLSGRARVAREEVP